MLGLAVFLADSGMERDDFDNERLQFHRILKRRCFSSSDMLNAAEKMSRFGI